MKGRLLSARLTVACVAVVTSVASHALGQGVVRDSIGATSSGRGGTNIAHFDNLTIILDNPAGLGNIAGDRLDFGLDFLSTSLRYDDPITKAHADPVVFPLPSFGYAKKSPDRRLTYGLGVFVPAGFGAHYDLRHLLYGTREYTSFGALVKILPAVAYNISDELSVGGTFGLGFSHVQFEAPFNLQSGLFAGVPCLLDMKASGLAPTWSVGMQYRLGTKTTIGLAFQGETRFKLHGDADVDISGFGFPLLKASYDIDVDLVWPRNLGFGITHRFNRQHRASFDVVWFDWSHAFDKLDMKLTNGSNPLFDLLLGNRVWDALPLDWDDSVAFRFGYEYFMTRRDVLRLGYIYHSNPVPSSTLIPLLAGTLEHAVSIGYGHQWDNWRVDLGYQFSWGSTDRVGFSDVIGGDYDQSSVRARAHWVFLTFSYRF
jgi:long-subunit fatty acid transport protein